MDVGSTQQKRYDSVAMHIVKSDIGIRQRIDICEGSGLKCYKANRVTVAAPYMFPGGPAGPTKLAGSAGFMHPAEYLHSGGNIGGRNFMKSIGIRPSPIDRIHGAPNILKLNDGGWSIEGSVFY